MNKALLLSMGRIHGKNIMSYAVGAVIYEWLVIWVYPSIAKSNAINTVIKSMPVSLQKAFGMQGGVRQLGDYLGAEFYGLIFILVLAAFTIMTAIQLVARLVNRGSMASLLATPVSRVKFATTQCLTLLGGTFVICTLTTIGGLIGAAVLVPGTELDVASYLQVNLTGFLLFGVISGFSFLCSSVFNDEKRALGVAAGVVVVEYGVHLISTLASSLSWFKYLTVFSTFDPQEILRGTTPIMADWSLALTAIVLYILAIRWFKSRDLPL